MANMPSETQTTDVLLKAVVRQDEQAVRQILANMRQNKTQWSEIRFRKTGDTALHVAARTSSMSIVRMLVEFCHSNEDERTNCETCHRLIEVGNNMGKRCLHEAAQICCVPIVEYLLRQGACVDPLKAADWTPLMLACCKGGLSASDSVRLLLENGANPLLKNKDGWTSLHLATRTGWVDTVRLLLQYNSEIVASPSCNGRTPLHIASLHGHTVVVEELLKAGSPVDPVDSCGLTPLHEAVRGGHIPIICILEQQGANIRKIDAMGLSCLHFAAQTGRSKVIEFLMVEYCMYVDQPSEIDKLTALHCAVRAGQTNCVKTLLSFGAQPDKRDAKGRTAQDFCSGYTSEEIENLLLSRMGPL
ncbi:Ankyrin repeat and KH domain-containing protein mask [Gryllus bimaculatus]|nr:Ankyrin repeat and KH domain-containing protein mask [Gryllus bimaculatus]